jgi:hypothetical protein
MEFVIINTVSDWFDDQSVIFIEGADKSLARPGRKQVNVSVRMA